MKTYTLYLDIDGVLSDFDKSWKVYKDEYPTKTWEYAVSDNIFEKLDECSNARKLLSFLSDFGDIFLPINVELLGSLGGSKTANQVRLQKLIWLQQHNIQIKPNFVEHKSHKKDYANSNTILIDDTPSNVDDFNQYGGFGILYSNDNWKDAVHSLVNHCIKHN